MIYRDLNSVRECVYNVFVEVSEFKYMYKSVFMWIVVMFGLHHIVVYIVNENLWRVRVSVCMCVRLFVCVCGGCLRVCSSSIQLSGFFGFRE